MAICVTPQQRLLGRALYSHLFLLGLAERVLSIRHESRHLPQPRTDYGSRPEPVIGRRDAPTRWPGRCSVCGAFAPDALPRIQFSNRRPVSCSLAPLAERVGVNADALRALMPIQFSNSQDRHCEPTGRANARRRSPDGRSTIRDGDTDESHGCRFAQSGATSANPHRCEGCLAIPLIIQDYRPLDEARGFFVPSMLFAPFRPRTSHVMGFGPVSPDRTTPKRGQKI